MEENLADSILGICTVFNKHAVQYMIVGGTAVALHGFYRWSSNIEGLTTKKPDLDFWYNPTYENYFRLLNALEALGKDVKEFKQEQAPNPKKSFFKFQFETFTLDLLPKLKAPLKFSASFEKREVVNIRGTDIHLISYNDLIKDKEANPRPKDIIDIQELKKKRKNGD